MSKASSYRVLSPIKAGGRICAVGSEVELDAAVAAGELKAGRIAPIELAGEEKGKGGNGSPPAPTGAPDTPQPAASGAAKTAGAGNPASAGGKAKGK